MGFTIVTQSRGDAARIAEWVDYHHRLGFDDFQIILDGLVDDTDRVLAGLDLPARIDVHRYPEEGEYFDGLPAAERARRVAQWRVDNAEWRATLKGKALDPIAVRQFRRIPEVLAPYAAGDRGRGWVAFIDVDEFLHLPAPRVHPRPRPRGDRPAAALPELQRRHDRVTTRPGRCSSSTACAGPARTSSSTPTRPGSTG